LVLLQIKSAAVIAVFEVVRAKLEEGCASTRCAGRCTTLRKTFCIWNETRAFKPVRRLSSPSLRPSPRSRVTRGTHGTRLKQHTNTRDSIPHIWSGCGTAKAPCAPVSAVPLHTAKPCASCTLCMTCRQRPCGPGPGWATLGLARPARPRARTEAIGG